jgi:hypothetical protein
MTTDLLTRVLDAHGGVERWQQSTGVDATIVSVGTPAIPSPTTP